MTSVADAGAIALAEAGEAEVDSADVIAAVVSAETDDSGCGDTADAASAETSSAASAASSSAGAASAASAEAFPPFAGSATASTGVNARSRLSNTDMSAVPTKCLLSFSVPIIVVHQLSGYRDDIRRRFWLRMSGL